MKIFAADPDPAALTHTPRGAGLRPL